MPQEAEVNLYEVELGLESLAIEDGIDRYQATLIEQGLTATVTGRKMLRKSLAPLVKAIEAERDLAYNGKAGRGRVASAYLSLIEPEKVAFLTAKVALDALCSREQLPTLALRLAGYIRDEVNDSKLKEAEPFLHRELHRRLPKARSQEVKWATVSKVMKSAAIDKERWSVSDRLHLGRTLFTLFRDVTGAIRFEKQTVGVNDTPWFVVPTERTNEWLEGAHAHAALLSPVYKPMVVPPVPWTTPYDGGYFAASGVHRKPLIKTRMEAYLEELASPEFIEQMQPIYRAVNAVQDTPWEINKQVLGVMEEMWKAGTDFAGLPPAEDMPLPAKPADIDTNEKAKKAWAQEAGRVREVNRARPAKREAARRTIRVAEMFAQYKRIHFPHTLDWRGRIYPMPNYLNPQGDDQCRGLLRFAEGQPLGENGAYWLAVHIANCYGVDKVSFDDRVQWVLDHEQEILDSAMDPLDGARFWATAEDPWQALAACFEWAGYKVAGDGYVSHLAIGMDGTCNGLQNLSAMLLDEEGGKHTNLVPSSKPADIYTRVAQVAQARVDSEARQGSEKAALWVGKVSRKIAKRPVMTMPYGVTRYGMGDQILGVLKDALMEGKPIIDKKHMFPAAKYIASVLFDSVGEVVIAARKAMDWLQDVAKVAASQELPVKWTTPSGLPVLQYYPKVRSVRIDTLLGSERWQLQVEEELEEISSQDMTNGISPNYVHSMDASHLVSTVNRLLDCGITSFAMIHDSYATHACNVDTLHRELRAAFVEQYSGNVLEKFRQQIIDQLPEEKRGEVPPVPPMGTLDLSQVTASEYFFA
jgi:DNA-directed RNA polymerase